MKKNGIKISDMGTRGLLFKPPGFWISINGDWERWCKNENFRNGSENFICDVKLEPHLQLVKISTVSDVEELVMFLAPNMPIYHFG